MLIGGDGFDDATGGKGDDVAYMRGYFDRFTWGPGDGSDNVDGGGSHDSLFFLGTANAEVFDCSPATASRRDVGNGSWTSTASRLDAMAGAGEDTIRDRPAAASCELNASLAPGSAAPTDADRIEIEGTDGDDDLTVTGKKLFSGTVTVTGLAAKLGLPRPERVDTLAIDTLDGDDTRRLVGPGARIIELEAKSYRSMPIACAAAAASRRERTPSLPSIAATWWSTVRTETTSRSAISAFVSPSLSSSSTASWRAVSPAGLACVSARGRAGTRAPSARSRSRARRPPWRRGGRGSAGPRASPRLAGVDELQRRLVRVADASHAAAAARQSPPRPAAHGPGSARTARPAARRAPGSAAARPGTARRRHARVRGEQHLGHVARDVAVAGQPRPLEGARPAYASPSSNRWRRRLPRRGEHRPGRGRRVARAAAPSHGTL